MSHPLVAQPPAFVEAQPLASLEEWDDHVRDRYDPNKSKESFRQYTDETPVGVREFYRQNHTHQTLDFVLSKKREYGTLDRRRMGIWAALEYLNTLVDESDPDTDLSQIEHCVQTAEAIRAAGEPDWMVLTGLIHDLGKVLCLWGEPQWAVVGDTFPVGCAWSPKIVYPEFFANNPDCHVAQYQTPNGIYTPHVGLDNVHLSWGHDEYLSMVVRDYLPAESLAMIRYHSCYPWHREGAYAHLTNEHDAKMLPWVQRFNPFDLYTKSDTRPDVVKLRPFYEELIARYFPAEVRW